jgi:hypothetical protein
MARYDDGSGSGSGSGTGSRETKDIGWTAASLDDLFMTAQLRTRLERVRRNRRLAIVALISIMILFLTAGSGITLNILTFLYSIQAEGDFPSRIVTLTASVLAFLLVVVHMEGSWTDFRSGETGVDRKWRHTVALGLGRVGVLVWLAAIILTSIVISQTPFLLDSQVQGKGPYLGILVCVIGL